MKNRGTKIRNIVCAILSVILAAGLGYFFYTTKQKDEAQAAALQALQDEASTYENELLALRRELEDLEEHITYVSDEAKIMVGFVASEASDVTYMETLAETYDFSPVLILDCTLDLTEIESIAEGADDAWEIMLYASTFSVEANENVLSVLSWLESAGKEQTGVFFLRADYGTETSIQILRDDGFIGYTSYHEISPAAGQTEDGMVYFDYSYLSSSGTSVTSRLAAMYTAKSSILVAFDMASIDAGALSESYVEILCGELSDYAENDDCTFSTVAAVVEELSGVNAVEAENRIEYEEQAAEVRERIEELEEIIDGIYAKMG